VNNDSHLSNTTIEIGSDSSCEIIDDHHETPGIEVNIFILFINSSVKYLFDLLERVGKFTRN